jgi:hypothetical protein
LLRFVPVDEGRNLRVDGSAAQAGPAAVAGVPGYSMIFPQADPPALSPV